MTTTRLEAIMFTDIAGYSRMMEANEDLTIGLLKTHNEIVFPIIDSHGGEVITSIGDGLLIVFPSIRKAVECAVAIHEQFEVHNDSVPADARMKLRIGIHLGEVQHEGGQVYGTGVNIAARVQPFALPGGICVSEDVFRHIGRQFSNEMVSIGTQVLRNISREYELYRIVTGYEDATQDGDVSAPVVQDVTLAQSPVIAAKPSGELDEVKERILTEIGKWSEKHGDERKGHSGEAGSKIFGIVEHVMDKAIGKWESMPEEKRSDIIHKIKTGIEENDRKKEEKAASSITGEISWGVAATFGFGLWYAQAGSVWMIIVGTLIGVLPLVSGIQKLIKRSRKKKKTQAIEPTELEGQTLRAAKELGGRVTVVQIAAHIGRPLDEVQHTLDVMTAKGYVIQEVLDTGIIRYDFPSLFPDEPDLKG